MRRFNVPSGELEVEPEPRAGSCGSSRRVGEAIGATLIGGTVYELGEGERVCP